MIFKTFRWSVLVTVIALGVAYLYGGTSAFAVAAILGVLEVSLSFDNAVINAHVLGRLNPFWQRMFLTVGILIAVFGMRLLFPLLIVGITAKLSPVEAVRLALDKGDPAVPGTYGFLLHAAHPAIAAFGGMFLLILFLDFIFEEREVTWLRWLEVPLARIGRLNQLSVIVALGVLFIVAETLAGEANATVLGSGVLGIVTYLLVNGLGSLFESGGAEEDEELIGIHGGAGSDAGRRVALATGKAAFFLFLYLEVLDASFSFDGVIGAFAITSDPIIIAIGLGVGALYIRSLTVYLVRQGTLGEYVYLEHGAHWAIGALALVLMLTIRVEVPEIITGLIGVTFIGAAFTSSLVRNRRNASKSTPAAA